MTKDKVEDKESTVLLEGSKIKDKVEKKESIVLLDGSKLTAREVYEVARTDTITVKVPNTQLQKINESRIFLDESLQRGSVVYGVNTSLGGFVNWLVPTDKATELQTNLISAVASNVGQFLDDIYVRAAMIVRLNSLARGHSAIRLENFNILLDMLNASIIPCIPEYGSLGASGDLGPLACIALVGCGKWKARYEGEILSGEIALERANLRPMTLSYKEGLALINGTSAMAGMASVLITKTRQLINDYLLISCLSFETLHAKLKPFSPIVHQLKNHSGQVTVASKIFSVLSDSQMIINDTEVERRLTKQLSSTVTEGTEPIEDAYSIRCTPQILGPVMDSLDFIERIINEEINSSSDNPLILCDVGDIIHNGHFHGQYISMVMDHLVIALATIANLTDRRIDRFLDKSNSAGLPPFLCQENPGLRLGLMGVQFCATSLTAEIRSLATPVSIQTLTSTADFQDHVSMGLVAARRVRDILDRLYKIIACELICACQAADIRGSHKLSSKTRALFDQVRTKIPYLDCDVVMTELIEEAEFLLRSGQLTSDAIDAIELLFDF